MSRVRQHDGQLVRNILDRLCQLFQIDTATVIARKRVEQGFVGFRVDVVIVVLAIQFDGVFVFLGFPQQQRMQWSIDERLFLGIDRESGQQLVVAHHGT